MSDLIASELVLLLESVKDPLDGVTLLLGRGDVVLKDLLDDVLELDGKGSLGSGGSGCRALARLLGALGGS